MDRIKIEQILSVQWRKGTHSQKRFHHPSANMLDRIKTDQILIVCSSERDRERKGEGEVFADILCISTTAPILGP
jgi:hypothetical protein